MKIIKETSDFFKISQESKKYTESSGSPGHSELLAKRRSTEKLKYSEFKGSPDHSDLLAKRRSNYSEFLNTFEYFDLLSKRRFVQGGVIKKI